MQDGKRVFAKAVLKVHYSANDSQICPDWPSSLTRIVPLVLAVALFMENMDATVIATSLPAIAADIGTTPVALKLAFTAYFVALAIFIPISAWMADKYGAKRVFMAAIVIFVLGSVACAFAGSLHEFVFARFFKGVGGAMMSPLARLILFRSTPRTELVNAMAWLTIPALVAPTVGPPVGGFLTTFFSWHWIFLINVPIGLAGLVMIQRFLPEIESGPLRRMDFPGFILVAIAFAGTLFGLSLLSLPVLPLWVAIVSTVVGLSAGVAYWLHANRTETPLLDPKMFREPAFRASIVGTAIFLVGVGAIPFLLPLMLQLSFGMTPFESGMITFIGALGALITKFFAKSIFSAFGFRNVLLIGAVVSAIAIAIKGTFTPETPVAVMMTVILCAGLIRSSYFTGQHALGLSQIKESEAGQATAISTVVRPLATALGVALAGGVLEISAHRHGGQIQLEDFHIAFFVVAIVSLFAALPFLRLSKDAGAAVSGHLTKEQREAALERSRSEGSEGRAPRF
ncbi:MFS transporter [Pelagibacterium lentulum]|uniref:MFS transporter n=1 Tax=Pelagibacterium lentulum TaxID=2029865 RepID=A0A916VXI0_9HYPH|nr:MFS transporter [Pelagibacterium lentulum]